MFVGGGVLGCVVYGYVFSMLLLVMGGEVCVWGVVDLRFSHLWRGFLYVAPNDG